MTDNSKKQNKGSNSSTNIDDLASLRQVELNEPMEDMEKLLSQSRRAFLLGAGCSKSAGLPLMDELTNDVLSSLPSKGKTHAVLKGLKENFKGASICTIEDLMSELVDLVSIANRRELRSASQKTVPINGKVYTTDDLKTALEQIKSSIAEYINEKSVTIDAHRRFVRSVHVSLQAGKTGRTRAVDYFTLNWDTLLEDALGLEQISNADGFSGGATGWWSVDCYSDLNIDARVLKVHGSIDWCLWKDELFPRRLRSGLPICTDAAPVMIWPAATKYREAQQDPFALIIQMMRYSLRPEIGSEAVLGICGYAFGDDHINTEIERALYESEQRLTLLVFTSDNLPKGLLEKWLRDDRVQDQVRVYANRGFFHGTKEYISKVDLPWWKFEVLAKLLEGQR